MATVQHDTIEVRGSPVEQGRAPRVAPLPARPGPREAVIGRVVREAPESGARVVGRVVREAGRPRARAIGRVVREAPESGAHALGCVVREAPGALAA
jgi:hypothetical protein